MTRLFVPPSVGRELIEERLLFTRALLEACHEDRVCIEWTRELRRLDPLLRMVKAPEHQVVGMPLVPGYYHLVRDNETTFPSVTPVQGPDGEFRVPDSALLEKVKSLDLQNAAVVAEHRLEQAKAQRAAERERQRQRELRRSHAREHWDAVSRTQVSLNDSVPWTQNAAGFRRVRGTRRAGGEPDDAR